MQAAVGAALVVVQAELLLELAVVVLDPPEQPYEPDERDQRCVGREVGVLDRPVLVLGSLCQQRPLGEQPVVALSVVSGPDAQPCPSSSSFRSSRCPFVTHIPSLPKPDALWAEKEAKVSHEWQGEPGFGIQQASSAHRGDDYRPDQASGVDRQVLQFRGPSWRRPLLLVVVVDQRGSDARAADRTPPPRIQVNCIAPDPSLASAAQRSVDPRRMPRRHERNPGSPGEPWGLEIARLGAQGHSGPPRAASKRRYPVRSRAPRFCHN